MKLVTVIFLISTLSANAFGDVSSILLWGVGSRSLGMGRTGASMAEDVTSVYYNPACLSGLKKFEFLGSYSMLYEDTSLGFIGFVSPTRFGSIGFGVLDVSTGGLEARDSTGRHLGDFEYRNTNLFFSFGSNLTDVFNLPEYVNWSAGSTIKILRESLYNVDGSAVEMDVGNLLIFPFESHKFLFGLNLQNVLASEITLLAAQGIPMVLRVSPAISLYNEKIKLAVDMLNSRNISELNLGVEYNPVQLISLRAGVNDREFTMGIGLTRGDMQVNYAILVHRHWRGINLGVSHTLDMKVRWVL